LNLPPMARPPCTSSKVAPILDTIAGAFGAVSFLNSTTLDDEYFTSRGTTRGAVMGLGAGWAAVFLGSAAYGYYTTSQCHNLKRGHTNAPSTPGAFPTPSESPRRFRGPEPDPWASLRASEGPPPEVPKAVGGFTFSASLKEVEKICSATQRRWELHDGVANCSPKDEGSSAEMTRLEFELGGLTKIAILHAPAQAAFNRDYDILHGKLGARYGRPSIKRAELTGDCAAALPECLKRGETPTGSTWFLPGGRIELVPVWRDDRAFIEERYKREEPPPQ